MVVNIKNIIEEAKEKLDEKRAENIEKKIDDALEKFSGPSFLKKGYYDDVMFPADNLNDRIAELIVDKYRVENPGMVINYTLVNVNNTVFYKFIFSLIGCK